MEGIIAFIKEVLPWLIAGTLVALAAAHFSKDKNTSQEEQQDNYMVPGMFIGMFIGAALTAANGMNAGICVSFGLMIGMMIGMGLKKRK